MPVTSGYSFAHYDSDVAVVDQVDTITSTRVGDLRGTCERGVAVWRGVDYAQQPMGDLRFAAPRPVEPWTGVRDATGHGPVPLQAKSFAADVGKGPNTRSEACLTLTVWSPDPHGSLPVMVWIPGGAFVLGAGQFDVYNGARLAANGRVVVVNVTYRVGIFGGFELGSLGTGFDDNLCLRDQIAALAWVRDNIAAFGGDPARVTVFGESAGGTSVLALLASPAADGLFGRAIAQSPALTLLADYDTRAEQTQRFLAEVGSGPGELKGLPQRTLRRAAGRIQARSVRTSPTLAYGLTYGTELLPQHPIAAAQAGAVAQLPLIVGTNSDEASMFAWARQPMLPTTPAAVDAFFARVAPDARERVLAGYPDYPRRRALVAFGSDVTFGAPTWAFADAYSYRAPTYAYRFDHAAPALRALRLGATHGSEIVHVHHTYGSRLGRRLHPLGGQIRPSVGRRMQRAWLQFAVGQHPLPDWPRYEVPRRATRVIRTSRDVMVDDPDATRRAAWEGLY